MSNQIIAKIITVLFILTSLSSCGSNIFKRADVKDVPINVNERVKKNIDNAVGAGSFDKMAAKDAELRLKEL